MIKCLLGIILAERRIEDRPPYTVTEVAEASGVHRDTITGLVSNKTTRYDAHVLDGLCRVLGIEVGDILKYVPDEQEED